MKNRFERIFVCPNCGNPNVQTEAWIDVNTDKVVDFIEDADYWCGECEEHFGQICLVEKGHEHGAKCFTHDVCTGERITA